MMANVVNMGFQKTTNKITSITKLITNSMKKLGVRHLRLYKTNDEMRRMINMIPQDRYLK
jgi:hypothetical protein